MDASAPMSLLKKHVPPNGFTIYLPQAVNYVDLVIFIQGTLHVVGGEG